MTDLLLASPASPTSDARRDQVVLTDHAMHNHPNMVTLIEAGRSSDAEMLLREGVQLLGSTGERSNRAALEVATRIYAVDLMSTIFFMNKVHRWLHDQTPIERAEQSDESLEFVIDMIGAIEAGVHI